MNEINRQVAAARRRLILQQFVGLAAWSIFSTVMLALLAILLPRLIAVPALVDGDRLELWSWGWLIGAVAAGMVVAIAVTFLRRRNVLDAAIEVDRRFGLKERVSSVVGLDQRDLETPSGKALIEDAQTQLSHVNVAQQFRIRPGWQTALPAVPMTAAILVALFAGGATPEAVDAALAEQAAQRQVKRSEQAFREQIAQQRKQAEQLGLKDAAKLLREIEQQYRQEAEGEKIDRKRALIRLNRVKKQAEQLKDSLASAEDLKKQLHQLRNVQPGPADKAASAIKNGQFDRAQQEIQKLADKVRKDELSELEQEQLDKQIADLQQQLDEHQRAKQELRDKIDQARRSGQSNKAEKLEEQLNQLAERDDEIRQLSELADKLAKVQKNLEGGNRQQAAKNLEDVASQLQDMQKQVDQLETMDQLLDKIGQAKNAMNCKECQGQGCESCQMGKQQGQMANSDQPGQQGDGDGNKPSRQGMGAGQGEGARPESTTEVDTFESKVDGNPQQGEVVRTGTAGGPNAVGQTREEVKAAVTTSLSQDPDPVNDQPLPRAQREHAKEYFRLFRERSVGE